MTRAVARIHYLNALPFFYGWADDDSIVSGHPRGLAHRSSDLLAGPLPLVEGWRLQDEFEPFGPWGIAVRNESRSVFVNSQRSFLNLENVPINVTPESSSSVALCRVLLKFKYGIDALIRVGFSEGDVARLVIGDSAFLQWVGNFSSPWNFRTDLAQEWWSWQKLPFVFARWVIRKDASDSERQWLADQIETSLRASRVNRPSLTHREGRRLGIPSEMIQTYLDGFTYTLGADEEKAINTFRTFYDQLEARTPLTTLGRR